MIYVYIYLSGEQDSKNEPRQKLKPKLQDSCISEVKTTFMSGMCHQKEMVLKGSAGHSGTPKSPLRCSFGDDTGLSSPPGQSDSPFLTVSTNGWPGSVQDELRSDFSAPGEV